MSTFFVRRLMRLENPSGNGLPENLVQILETGRRRAANDPEGAQRDAEARFQALAARETDGGLCDLEQRILAGMRRVRAHGSSACQ